MGADRDGEPCYRFPPVNEVLPAIQAVSQCFKRGDKASASHMCRLSLSCQALQIVLQIWGNNQMIREKGHWLDF